MAGFVQQGTRLWRHRWAEARLHSVLPEALSEQLARQVADSERRHTGQVRICVEAGLPAAYVWRNATARERAVALFGKLGVWDTEDNNGVLIYLLLAEHAIELVADRGVHRLVPPDEWAAIVARLSNALQSGSFEDGLTQALEEVSAVLVSHFPQAEGGSADTPLRPNALPDEPVLR